MNIVWIVEHKAFGAYLGQDLHPRTGAMVPLYRKQDPRKPILTFPTKIAATDAVCEFATSDASAALFTILPIAR